MAAPTRGVERYIRITVDADQALRDINRIERNTRSMTDNLQGIGRALNLLVFSELAQGLSQMVEGLINLGDVALDTSTKLNAIVGPDMGTALFGELLEIANRTGVQIEELAASFVKMQLAVADTDISTDQVVEGLDTVSTVLSTTGASVQQVNAVLLQLTQGLGAGALQGDEFRSVIENSPVLLYAWRDALGLSDKAIKQMSADADFTTESFFRLNDQIRANVISMTGLEEPPLTISRAFNQLRNEFIDILREMQQGESVFSAFADILQDMAKWLAENDELVKAFLNGLGSLIQIGAELVATVLRPMVSGFTALGNAIGLASEKAPGLVSVLQQLASINISDLFFFLSSLGANIGEAFTGPQINDSVNNTIASVKELKNEIAGTQSEIEKYRKLLNSYTGDQTDLIEGAKNALLDLEELYKNQQKQLESVRAEQELIASDQQATILNSIKATQTQYEKEQKILEDRTKGYDAFYDFVKFKENEREVDIAKRAEREAKSAARAARSREREIEREAKAAQRLLEKNARETQKVLDEVFGRPSEELAKAMQRLSKEQKEYTDRYINDLIGAFTGPLRNQFQFTIREFLMTGTLEAENFMEAFKAIIFGGIASIITQLATQKITMPDLVSGETGGGIFDFLTSKTFGENLAEVGKKMGDAMGVAVGDSLENFAETSNWAYAAGATIGLAAGSVLGGGTMAGSIGAAIGTAAGVAIGTYIAGGAGTVVGGAVGGAAGGAIGGLFGGSSDGIKEMKATFTFANDELTAATSRLGSNAIAFGKFMRDLNVLFDAVFSNFNEDAQKAISELEITLDRSSSSSLEEFAAKVGELFQQILNEASQYSDFADLVSDTFQETGGDFERFAQEFDRIIGLFNTFQTAAGNLSGIETSLDGLARLYQEMGDVDFTAVVAGLESLASLIETMRTDEQKLERATRSVEETFAELGSTVPETMAEFVELVEGLDLTTVAGAEMARALGEISDALRVYYEDVERKAKEATEAALEEAREQAKIQEEARQKELEDARKASEEATRLREEADRATVELMRSFVDALRSINETLNDSIKSIEEYGLSEEELFARRQEETAALEEQLRNATDPEEIRRLVNEINSLVKETWGMLSDEEKARYQDDALAYLESIREIATEKLREGMEAVVGELGIPTKDMNAVISEFNEILQDLGKETIRWTDNIKIIDGIYQDTAIEWRRITAARAENEESFASRMDQSVSNLQVVSINMNSAGDKFQRASDSMVRASGVMIEAASRFSRSTAQTQTTGGQDVSSEVR